MYFQPTNLKIYNNGYVASEWNKKASESQVFCVICTKKFDISWEYEQQKDMQIFKNISMYVRYNLLQQLTAFDIHDMTTTNCI